MGKESQGSPFIGRWEVTCAWNPYETCIDRYVTEDYFQFDAEGTGGFRYESVQGSLDYKLTTRDGAPAVEWTWRGASVYRMSEKMEQAFQELLARYATKRPPEILTGEGYAVLRGAELHGTMSGFVATAFLARYVLTPP